MWFFRCLLSVVLFFLGCEFVHCATATSQRRGWFFGKAKTPTKVETNQKAEHSSPLNATAVPEWKKALPPPLKTCGTLQRILISDSIELYLLGTSHVSNDSNAHAQILLDHLHPEVVFVELCVQRVPMMMEPDKELLEIDHNQTMKFWDRVRMIQNNPERRQSKLSAMGTVMLTQVQQDYADSLGVELGGEFRAAYRYCLARPEDDKPHLILGDRPLQLTLARAWASLRWYKKAQLLMGLTWSCLKKTDPEKIREWMQQVLDGDEDVLTKSMLELQRHFPTLAQVILKERDAYMACKLFQTSRLMAIHGQRRKLKIVAIVGAGHVKGITSWLTNGNEKSPEQVLRGLIETKHQTSEAWASMKDALVTEVAEFPY